MAFLHLLSHLKRRLPTRFAGAAALYQRDTLGLDGLPKSLLQLVPKRVYTVLAAPSTARDALLMHTLKQGLEHPAILVSPRSATLLGETLAHYGIALSDERVKKHLALFALDIGQHAAPANPGGILRELAHYKLGKGGLLLLEGVEPLLDWGELNALKKWIRAAHDWAERQGGRVLWLIEPDAAGQRMAALHRVQQQLGGIAQLVDQHGEPQWQVACWHGNDNSHMAERYPLRFNAHGRLALAKAGGGALMLAPDEGRVLATTGVTAGEPWVPESWQLYDGFDAVQEACTGAEAATVLLDYRRSEDLELLLRTVHQLRRQCGGKLKIVVREVGMSLRYQTELLLLSVGANKVVGRAVGYSRFLSLVQAVQGQLYTRLLPDDFEQAVRGVLDSEQSGYLPAAAFIACARASLERARSAGIACCLVRLPLQPQTAHWDALQQCRLARPGDVFSADEQALYLFLFACRVPDVPLVLERVFAGNRDALFEGELRLFDEAPMLAFLDEFERRVRDRAPIDYSAQLAELEQVQPAGAMLSLPEADEAPLPVLPRQESRQAPESRPRQVTPFRMPLRQRATEEV
jgi:cellulose biosynthesis protein BcsE